MNKREIYIILFKAEKEAEKLKKLKEWIKKNSRSGR